MTQCCLLEGLCNSTRRHCVKECIASLYCCTAMSWLLIVRVNLAWCFFPIWNYRNLEHHLVAKDTQTSTLQRSIIYINSFFTCSCLQLIEKHVIKEDLLSIGYLLIIHFPLKYYLFWHHWCAQMYKTLTMILDTWGNYSSETGENYFSYTEKTDLFRLACSWYTRCGWKPVWRFLQSKLKWGQLVHCERGAFLTESVGALADYAAWADAMGKGLGSACFI